MGGSLELLALVNFCILYKGTNVQWKIGTLGLIDNFCIICECTHGAQGCYPAIRSSLPLICKVIRAAALKQT